eukprot:GHRQ01033472.1.p1 GENE.GHRQ01033472.1~~GHRQ01033472.1.p1  ORF type:complete len:101 (+),score=1.05 GHRQ01033472.1:43-345(+)
MSSSCNSWSLPTFCGRCLALLPQTCAYFSCFSIVLWILLQKPSIVALERCSTTGSLKSGSLPLGLVYTRTCDDRAQKARQCRGGQPQGRSRAAGIWRCHV